MFERDPFGLNPQLPANRHAGGIAPTRHALRRQHYLTEKRARLAAETAERRLQEDDA